VTEQPGTFFEHWRDAKARAERAEARAKRYEDALRKIYRYPSDSYSAQAAFDMYEIARAALPESEEP
jgi:hypothetical protein